MAIQWPPIDWLWGYYRRMGAWYSGDERGLRAMAGACEDFWRSDEKIKVHVPMAADIAALSAGLIFSDAPEIKSEDERTQERIAEIMKQNGAYALLLQAAELASVHGGVLLKWNWAQEDGMPVLSVVPAPFGLPEWAGQKLKRITFYNPVREDEMSGTRWTLMERYEDDGRIHSSLLRGSGENLGTEVPLDSIPETAGIEPEAVSGAGALLAVYVPNLLPNRIRPWQMFGRSDFDGLTGLFDALDEAYSAIQRETRLTKTTVIVPAEYLRKRDSIFPGEDAVGKTKWVFTNDSGVFTALDIDTGENTSPIQVVNPGIQADQRIALCEDIIRRILSMAGYSPQSAGLDISGQAESGTALNIRERKSLRTTETKKTYWWHALNDMVRAGLRLDAAVFKSGVNPEAEISVEMPDNSQPDISQMADILERLERAGAVSTQTKVALLHPDWTPEQVDEEVGKINLEKGVGMDPLDARMGDLEGGNA